MTGDPKSEEGRRQPPAPGEERDEVHAGTIITGSDDKYKAPPPTQRGPYGIADDGWERLEGLLQSYEARGVRCFPVRTDKRPWESWPAYLEESVGERIGRFRRTWQNGAPFLIAGIPGDNAVLDVDDPAEFDAALGGGPLELNAPVVCTPSGGVHYWFASSAGLSFTDCAWGELRTGLGHFVILPGSGYPADYEKGGRHIRAPYTWAPGCTPLPEWDGELPEMPARLVHLVEVHSRRSCLTSSSGGLGGLVLDGVGRGSRNEVLFRYASSCRARGVDQAEALTLVGQAAANCTPPYPSDRGEEPVEDMVARVYGTYPAGGRSKETGGFFDGDRFIPRRLAQAIAEDGTYAFGYDPERGGGQLMSYEGGVWRPAVGLDVEVQRRLGEDVTTHRVSETIAALEREVPHRPWSDWNAEPRLVNCANGILDPTTLELKPHDAGYFSTLQVPVWWEPEAQSARMGQFLVEVLPEDCRGLVTMMLGYLLIPDITADKFFVLVGPESTGKTTFLSVVQALIGERNVAVASLQDLADNRFALAQVDHKLLCVFDDLDNAPIKRASVPKVLTGGFPRIRVERKCKDAYEAPLYARLLFTCNEMPTSPDKTGAWYRRVCLVPFDRKPVEEDRDLMAKLTAPAALQRLLVLAVKGLGALIERGMEFPQPESCAGLLRKYRTYNDSVAAFVEERCAIGPEEFTQRPFFYDAYTKWCQESGLHPVERTKALARLRNLVPIEEVKRDHGIMVIKGLSTWRPEPPALTPASNRHEVEGEMGTREAEEPEPAIPAEPSNTRGVSDG